MASGDEGSRKLAGTIKAALAQQDVDVFSPFDMNVGVSIRESTQKAIRGADAVVADITGANSNVMFEVGLAVGLRKPILLLTRERSAHAPTETYGYQVAVYRPEDLDSVRKYVELWLRDAVPGAETPPL
jgi:nucleoside 2-deoxyribosyltransferase